MNTKNTLGMLAFLVALLLAYWLTDLFRQSAERSEHDSHRLSRFEAGAIVEIRVERVGENPVYGTRNADGEWAFVEPYPYIESNPIVWNRLADAVATVTNERTIQENPKDLDLYELDPPHLIVEAKTEAGESVRIVAGAIDPTQEYRYARADDGPVVLITTSDFHELNRSLLDLRQRFVLPPSDSGIDRLQFAHIYTGGLESDDPEFVEPEIGDVSVKVVLERDADLVWQMHVPVETRANQARVQTLIDEVRFMTGRNYIDNPENLSDYGLDPPERILTVHEGEGDMERTLMIGWVAAEGEGGGIFAKIADNPSVFVIDAHIISLLPRTPDAFRETRLLSGEATNLAAIRYRDEHTELRLVNDETTGWTLVEPPFDDVAQNAVSAYIAFLKGIGGTSFPVDPEAPGFDHPAVGLELFYRGAAESTTILIGGTVPDTSPPLYYAKQEDGAITTVPLAVMLAMRASAFKFRDKRIFRFPEDRALKIALQLDGNAFEFKKVGETWAVVQPENMRIESQADVRDLLRILSRAQALSVVSPTPPADVQGLDSPIFSARVEYKDNEEPHVLGPFEIGASKASSSRERFARVEGRPEVFFVDQDLIDDLRAVCGGFTSRR